MRKLLVPAIVGNLMDMGLKNKGPSLKWERIPAIVGARY